MLIVIARDRFPSTSSTDDNESGTDWDAEGRHDGLTQPRHPPPPQVRDHQLYMTHRRPNEAGTNWDPEGRHPVMGHPRHPPPPPHAQVSRFGDT